MIPGQFARNLRKLNSNLRVFCGDNDRFSAGIFTVSKTGEYQEVCGADKNQVPEWTIYDETGRIVKTGWRRVLRILVGKKLIDRKAAEKLFRANLSYKQAPWQPPQNAFEQKLKSYGLDVTKSGRF